MLSKICTAVFFIGMALWAFGIGLPFLMVAIGISAYGLMSSRDVSSNVPVGYENIVWDTTTNVLQLVVVHAPSANNGNFLALF